MTWSFSSGVWSRGTTTSAQERFWSSLTCRRNRETTVKTRETSHLDSAPTSNPRPLAHRLPALPDDTSCGEGGNLDVSLQLHLLLGPEEVLLLQFTEDSTLSLQGHMGRLNMGQDPL